MQSAEFRVKTDNFEGPLELLLELIEKRKLFINDVSLAEVADDYIAHIKGLEEFPMHDAAHFVLVASTLLLIKSKSLLPDLQLTEDEQQDIAELERRLVLYKRVRFLSGYIRKMFGRQVIFSRQYTGHNEVFFTPTKTLSKSSLHGAALALIGTFPVISSVSTAVVEKVMSLEQMIGRLADRIQKNLSVNFSEFSKEKYNHGERGKRMSVIVSFLAMLELVKTGIIAVRQDRTFADIKMQTQDVNIPDYR